MPKTTTSGKSWIDRLKFRLRPTWFAITHSGKPVFHCPICGFDGPFKDKRISRDPDLVRIFSKCIRCGSAERHRMLSKVFEEVFGSEKNPSKKILHIAPEVCLTPILSKYFKTYHTSDLFKQDVDFNEDIQEMSFEDASYDSVVVSRVLTIPPDVNASVSEMQRILKPGGVAVIAEIYSHEKTNEFGKMIEFRSREVGIDMLDLYRKHFSQVELFLSDRYDSKFQLNNLMRLNGTPKDDYPEAVRIPGEGFKDLVAVCRK